MTRESAVVIHVPEAEPLVGAWRLRYDQSAGAGVPAHITLLYPFVPPDDFGADVDAELAAVFADVSPFEIFFRRTATFGSQVLFLDPEPDGPLVDMTRRLSARFRLLPYGGSIPIAEIKPHLTVVDGEPSVVDEVQRALADGLPLSTHATEATVIACDDEWRWTTRGAVPFGGR